MRSLIVERAAKLWADAGSPSGRDEEFWLEAEKQITQEQAAKAEPPTATKEEQTAKEKKKERDDHFDDIDAYNRRGTD